MYWECQQSHCFAIDGSINNWYVEITSTNQKALSKSNDDVLAVVRRSAHKNALLIVNVGWPRLEMMKTKRMKLVIVTIPVK